MHHQTPGPNICDVLEANELTQWQVTLYLDHVCLAVQHATQPELLAQQTRVMDETLRPVVFDDVPYVSVAGQQGSMVPVALARRAHTGCLRQSAITADQLAGKLRHMRPIDVEGDPLEYVGGDDPVSCGDKEEKDDECVIVN